MYFAVFQIELESDCLDVQRQVRFMELVDQEAFHSNAPGMIVRMMPKVLRREVDI